MTALVRSLCTAVLLLLSTFARAEGGNAIYIHAGALLDRPGEVPRGASTIIVRDERIEAVRDGHVPPQEGARLIDLSQQFVLPGLIDLHVHIFSDDDKMRSRREQNNRDNEDVVLLGADNARRTLEAGFTTIRDLGSNIRSVTALRDAINVRYMPGPTIVPAGRVIAITAGHGDPSNGTNRDITENVRARSDNLCDGADDCRRAVRMQISQGAEVIKFAATGGVNSNIAGGLKQQMFPDEMRAIVETAHMFGRRVAAHAHGADGIRSALEAGVDTIEHGTYTDTSLHALYKDKGAWLVPTMMAPHAALAQARAGDRSPASLVKGEEAAAVHATNIAAAIKAGVKIAFGTDTGVSAHGQNAQEFALLVSAGMSPAAAIQAATADAAIALDRADQLGTIEPGKQADLIAVASSPLEDITELERVQFVMRRGFVHKLNGTRQAFP